MENGGGKGKNSFVKHSMVALTLTCYILALTGILIIVLMYWFNQHSSQCCWTHTRLYNTTVYCFVPQDRYINRYRCWDICDTWSETCGKKALLCEIYIYRRINGSNPITFDAIESLENNPRLCQ
eukprot:TRINITY_DN6397_c0_g1_i1.p1 TRINITY_DN6397_c0_g1~~TRINITY_DN6397_c0_g1_i1.p1  ORF type:complete len:132 (-),score=4.34 TRINITY_DN6397_c0_g1_i1:59-430(-)